VGWLEEEVEVRLSKGELTLLVAVGAGGVAGVFVPVV
jgi:hypothetical protein